MVKTRDSKFWQFHARRGRHEMLAKLPGDVPVSFLFLEASELVGEYVHRRLENALSIKNPEPDRWKTLVGEMWDEREPVFVLSGDWQRTGHILVPARDLLRCSTELQKVVGPDLYVLSIEGDRGIGYEKDETGTELRWWAPKLGGKPDTK